jgi:hypothetical protein
LYCRNPYRKEVIKMENLAVLEKTARLVQPVEVLAIAEIESVAPAVPALPVPAEKTRGRSAAAASEDVALEKALKAVEREQYLSQVKLETDVALFAYCIDPFSGR